MSSYLRPRRGKKATAIAQLTSSNPLKRGEIFFEVPDDGVGTGAGKIKMGDGTTAYADLPYFSEGGGSGGIGQDISISLPKASWTTETISGTTYYVQTGAAAGASSTTVPVIVPIYTTDTEMEAYSNIIRVEPSANAIKFIAASKPGVDLTVVAKFAVETTADLQAITDVLGSASEASAVTGTTAFGKINTLNTALGTANGDISWYATCSTGASTTAKVATTSDSKFTLVTGAKVRVKFTYTNTATTPTLNVDGKGAKTIYGYGTTKPGIWWSAGDVVEFTYNGSAWIMGATAGQVTQLNNDLNSKANASDIPTLQNVSGYTPISDGMRILGLNMLRFGDIALVQLTCDGLVKANAVNVKIATLPSNISGLATEVMFGQKTGKAVCLFVNNSHEICLNGVINDTAFADTLLGTVICRYTA